MSVLNISECVIMLVIMVKYIKCPNCGHVFKRPLMDRKFSGLGFNPPGLGVLRCPNCQEEKRRKYFEVVPEGEAEATQVQAAPNHKVEASSEKDLIEDSRYEDE